MRNGVYLVYEYSKIKKRSKKMNRRKYYVVPDTDVIVVRMEQLMQTLSTEHNPAVQDEVEDESEDDDAPFGF